MIRATPWWRSVAALLTVTMAVGCVGCTSTGRDDQSTSASPGPVASTVSFDDQIARSDTLLSQTLPSDGPGCSAAAAVDGRVVWADARGLADVGAGTALTTDTLFDIGSVSQQFTATAILLLVQEGRLALDDPLSAHVPGLPAWADQVTVANLLHHTSGIRDVVGILQSRGFTQDMPVTTQDALDAMATIKELRFKPGTVWEYSHSNYLLLGEIVHTISGQELPAFLQERVFGPLDLAMTLGPQPSDQPATGYTTLFGDLKPSNTAWVIFGPGSIVTTPSELVRWADNYRQAQVGGPDLLAAVTAGATPVSSAADASRYGAGILEATDGSLEHDGGIWGQRGYFAVAPDRHTAIAVDCNRDDDEALIEQLATGLRAAWFGSL